MNTHAAVPDPLQLELDLTPPDPRAPHLARLLWLLRSRLFARHDEEARRARQTDTRDAWYEIRAALGRRIVGHADLLDYLAVVALMHRSGSGTHRILLCGPPGSGKTHISRVLAEVTGSPFLVQDAQTVTESGWHGASLAEILDGWARRTPGGLSAIERGALVLDECGKLRVHPQAHGNAIDKRRGVQANLLALLGIGTPVSIGISGDAQLRSERMLIILADALSDASWSNRAPTPEELVRYGMLAELVDRLTDIVYVPAQPPEELARVYAEGPTSISQAEQRMAEELGYMLEIAPATYRYVALAVSRAGGSLGQRAGGHWIATAARGALARALREGLPPGSILRITPDDVSLPSWTEAEDRHDDFGDESGGSFIRSPR